MTSRFLLLSLFLFSILFVGCQRVPVPQGFPAVVQPVTVKVVKGDKPISDITVVLHAQDPTMHFLVTGDTGTDGIATIRTIRGTYAKPGAPAGKYRVQLTEPLQVDIRSPPDMPTPEQEAAWQKEYSEKVEAIRTFSKQLSSVSDSPLEIEVASPPVAVEFDVGKY